tara:strand:+ start:483 stop:653 length:171 start_codon:yes stop_codon:yes gene_type:complete
MFVRPNCDFCESKSDIYENNNSKKTYYCGGCYLKKKPRRNETNHRPRDQWVSRKTG